MDSSTVRERAHIAGLKVSAGNAGGPIIARYGISKQNKKEQEQ